MSDSSHDMKWTMSTPPSDSTVSKNGKELSLTVRSDHEYGQGITSTTRVNHDSNQVKLDINNVDILGPAEVVKKLFCLPVTKDEPYFALHRMGNTLLIDSINGFDAQRACHDNDDKKYEEIALFAPDRPQSAMRGHATVLDALTNCSMSQLVSSCQDLQLAALSSDKFSSESSLSDDNTASTLESPFLPPPGFYMPQCPPPMPFRHILRWQLQNLRFALGSDLVVCSTREHPALTIAPMDTTREVELSTCVDHYLDNVMANVPELALCLHAKGFLRGLSVCRTEDIPRLDSTLRTHMQQGSWERGGINKSAASGSGKESFARPSGGGGPRQQAGPCEGDDGGGGGGLFDPKVIEFNAVTILRFLRENCHRDSGTYIVHMQRPAPSSPTGQPEGTGAGPGPGPGAIEIFDLQGISLARQKKWKWLLAMLSQRFAVRLGQHYQDASPPSRVIIRDRQMSLFQSCYDLLVEIRQMGGGGHGTIRASTLEQMADIKLARAESRRRQKCAESYDSSRAGEGGAPGVGLRGRENSQQSGQSKRRKKHKNTLRGCHGGRRGITPSGQVDGAVGAGSSGESVGELDSIDFSAEMLEGVQILQKAMTDLLESIHSSSGDGGGGGSEDESEEAGAGGQSILVGDVPCEAVGDGPGGGGRSAQSVEDDTLCDDACSVTVTLALQYSGLLHKAMLSCVSVVRHMLALQSGHCGEAVIAEAVRILDSLVPFGNDWVDLTAKLKSHIMNKRKVALDGASKRQERVGNLEGDGEEEGGREGDGAGGETSLTVRMPTLRWAPQRSPVEDEEEAQRDSETMLDFWGIDRTILADMPLLWDVFGEVCRELSYGRRNHAQTTDGRGGGGGGRERSGSAGLDEEWGMWSTLGCAIRRLACCFTAMGAQASSFAPMDAELNAVLGAEGSWRQPPSPSSERPHRQGGTGGDLQSIAIVTDVLCANLCGGGLSVSDKSSSVLSTLLRLFCRVAPCVVLPPPRAPALKEGASFSEDGLAELLKVRHSGPIYADA